MKLSIAALATVAMLAGVATPAHAEKLYSMWRLSPTTATGERTVAFNDVILEQQLQPLKAVRLSEAAVTQDGKTFAADTPLFRVFQDDGRQAYCTVKDRSPGNVAKSLFIPALDKRPCFVDRDGDRRFDAAFSVFDKYGSALAPSGDLKSAVNLQGGGAYAALDSAAFPSAFRFTFQLNGKREAAKARVDVSFDNGSGKPVLGVARNERTGSTLTVLNARFEFLEVTGEQARIVISPDSQALLMGESGGSFAVVDALPTFLATGEQEEDGTEG
ncbi:hypothetical protein GRI89_03605 [Altererythrobacter salegens]|uniref:Uncharacterized protein n=1 Tax=Croceibacterium salegens TaxID=1737568 RepID=A0A6I4SU74_9SPHN|nr:hypothetical protein [Croceibacterium salegens]MXO58627.1 hypothetical protein [Croceibacterium salegens]